MKKATIIVKDEVNVKIEGLDLDTRRRLTGKFKYEIPGARYMPAVRLGRWDGKVAFFQLGGSTFVNLLPEIIPILIEENYEIGVDDRRTYQVDYDLEKVDEQSFSDRKWPSTHPAAGDSIILRDYQVEIINNFLKNPQSIQEIATGSGKTIMTAALSQRIEKHGRSIVIVPNKSLVTQTEKDYSNMGLDVGVFYGDRKEFGHQHTICTWQSLNGLMKNTKNQTADISISEFLEDIICVIVDECFDGDTLITTPQGKTPIKDLKAGDKVINLCEKTKQYKEDTVVKVYKNLTHSESEKMLELEFDNGVKTQVTANHKFLTNKGWIRADELTDNIEIIDINTYG
jgi:hypothetical protein